MTGQLDLSAVIFLFTNSRNAIYQYSGSFTTPPCTEGVTWFVAKRTLDVDVDDWHKLKKLMKFNARYPQNTPGGTNLIQYASDNLPKKTCPT